MTGTYTDQNGVGQLICAVASGIGIGGAQKLMSCLAQAPGYERGAPAIEVILGSLPGYTETELPQRNDPVAAPVGLSCERHTSGCFDCCSRRFEACVDGDAFDVPVNPFLLA